MRPAHLLEDDVLRYNAHDVGAALELVHERRREHGHRRKLHDGGARSALVGRAVPEAGDVRMGLQKVTHGGTEPALAEAVNDSNAGGIGEKGIVEELINERHRFINAHADEHELALGGRLVIRPRPGGGIALRPRPFRGPAGRALGLGVLRALNEAAAEANPLAARIDLDVRVGERGDETPPAKRWSLDEVSHRERARGGRGGRHFALRSHLTEHFAPQADHRARRLRSLELLLGLREESAEALVLRFASSLDALLRVLAHPLPLVLDSGQSGRERLVEFPHLRAARLRDAAGRRPAAPSPARGPRGSLPA